MKDAAFSSPHPIANEDPSGKDDDQRGIKVPALKLTLTEALRRLPINQRTRHSLRTFERRLKRWAGFPAALPGSSPDTFRVPQRAPGAIDFVFFGIVDWHFRFQRPQQLAAQLVRSGHRVLYVSSNFIDDSGDAFRVESLDATYPLYQISLSLLGAPGIYWEAPSNTLVDQIRRGVDAAMEWSGWHQPVFILGHPFWSALCGSSNYTALVYDRMDYHAGFGSFSNQLRDAERKLMCCADLTVCSSQWLLQDTACFTPSRALIQNATDFDYFARRPDLCYRDPEGRQVIGYYGAIAPWLDLDIVIAVAEQFPDCSVLLIGLDQIGAGRLLSRHRNIKVLDEVPYSLLPGYLHGFDVCILPRVVNALTRAMNPVKLYEYLSAGRPVVATNLPDIQELAGLPGLVYACSDQGSFLDAVKSALAEAPDDPRMELRRHFAAGQTWVSRAAELERLVRPLVTPKRTMAEPRLR